MLSGNVSEGRGMAFVIVQHVDLAHEGIMLELLKNKKHMKVVQAKDHTSVKPDCRKRTSHENR